MSGTACRQVTAPVVDAVHSVLTGRAVPAADLDSEVAQQQLETARARPANSDELMATRDRMVQQARGQLRVAGRS